MGVAAGLLLLPLKRVRLEGDVLFISNYLREISVPAQTIASVRQNRWWNHRPITVTFRQETEFGAKIVFMPRWTRRIYAESDEVALLRDLAGIE